MDVLTPNICHGMTCPYLTCPDLICPDFTCPDLTSPDFTCPDLENLHTPSRHPLNINQPPDKHYTDSGFLQALQRQNDKEIMHAE